MVPGRVAPRGTRPERNSSAITTPNSSSGGGRVHVSRRSSAETGCLEWRAVNRTSAAEAACPRCPPRPRGRCSSQQHR